MRVCLYDSGMMILTRSAIPATIIRHRLLLVLLLAVCVRLIFLVMLRDTLDFQRAGNAIHGSEAYDAYAMNLLETGVYGRTPGIADASIPPMYSLVLALAYHIGGRSFITVAALHILFDLLALALLYDIGRRLFGGARGAWIGTLAALLTACYPYLVFQNLTLIDTGFWMLLLHLYVWLMLLLRARKAIDRRTLLLALLAGLVLGMATLTRPITPPLALLLALWFVFRLSLWQTILRLLPVALIGVAVAGVWITRNALELNAFIPMTTTSGANFWQGNSPWTIAVFQAGYDVQWTAPVGIPKTLPEREQDALRFADSLAFLRANPDQLPLLWWTKFTVHWNPQITPLLNPQPDERWELDDQGALRVVAADSSIAGITNANTAYNGSLLDTLGRPIHVLYFGGSLLLALISIPLTAHLWRDVTLLWFVQISMTLIYIVFHPSTRYRSPSDPLLFVMSAAAVVFLWEWWHTRRA